tara:strand:+ start:143 stop:256 length:114 start_codon:yes stop_codon:yes gene_type:complete
MLREKTEKSKLKHKFFDTKDENQIFQDNGTQKKIQKD